jgi:chromosome segregation ATPase
VVFDNENIYIVNDEIEGLKLTISSLKAQIDEQKKENERHIEGYKKDKQYRINENESQQKYYFEQIISLTDKINKLRSICRENTKELIKTKSNAKMLDKKTKSQLARYAEDMRILKNCFTEQKDKCNDLKKNMKIKISKKNDDIINNLRKQLGKYEEELKIEKSKNQNIDEKYKKKIEILNNKIKKINSNYKSLEKRRDCEIEGFTNDILRLRKQLKALENHLVNTESPLDKEMELLNLARNTGKRAEKMTEEIKKYKNKISNIEKQIHTLAF